MSRANQAAFPIAGHMGPNDNYQWGEYGLTVREHFAAMAMQGLCAGPAAKGSFSSYVELGMPSADALLAKMSVDIADALISELGKVRP